MSVGGRCGRAPSRASCAGAVVLGAILCPPFSCRAVPPPSPCPLPRPRLASLWRSLRRCEVDVYVVLTKARVCGGCGNSPRSVRKTLGRDCKDMLVVAAHSLSLSSHLRIRIFPSSLYMSLLPHTLTTILTILLLVFQTLSPHPSSYPHPHPRLSRCSQVRLHFFSLSFALHFVVSFAFFFCTVFSLVLVAYGDGIGGSTCAVSATCGYPISVTLRPLADNLNLVQQDNSICQKVSS
jgi:hypothetical protein